MFCSVVLLAFLASVQGRAVNISNTWVLPEEGFPVFYRYFRDRISWYEADAVCQFHHANLVTVDTTAQYDAVRAYLKELDISSAVWVGLIRSNPDGDFTWTDYRGLSSDGYWSSAPDARSAPLCAAADPAADYRWEARACGGPMVASFICELPVPQWALGNEGCMVRALPALTALYLPESAAVQLTADCGMAGVKKVQCTGNIKREALLKELSCNEDNESSSVSGTASEATWPVTTDTSSTDQDASNEETTEVSKSTKNEEMTTEPSNSIKPFIFNNAHVNSNTNYNKISHILLDKDITLMSNNLQSNDIPQIAGNDNFLIDEQNEKLEDEKNLKHKMLHDELARLGNFDTIFAQPADHFVPPLVMAKSKMNDDMTIMSIKEKHAQQLAEQKIAKYNLLHKQNAQPEMEHNDVTTTTVKSTDMPIVTMQTLKFKDNLKKETIKSTLPKKYIEKYNDAKSKTSKQFEKVAKPEKITTDFIQPSTHNTFVQTTTLLPIDNTSDLQSGPDLDLTVIFKEPSFEKPIFQEIETNETGAAHNEQITTQSGGAFVTHTSEIATKSVYSTEAQTAVNDQTTTKHEVIKITFINDNVHSPSSSSPKVIELTTRVPFTVESESTNIRKGLTTNHDVETTETHTSSVSDRNSNNKEALISSTMNPLEFETVQTETNVATTDLPVIVNDENITIQELETTNSTTDELTTPKSFISNTVAIKKGDSSTALPNDVELTTSTTILPFTENVIRNTTNDNVTEHELKTDSSESIDYLNSPLLSAANEPLHRPNRSRRPQPPNRITKFNPFRILG